MEPHRLALTPGYQIEHFRIEATLGKGGFGITYVALDLQLGKRVAIKELLPDTIATRLDSSTVVPHSASMQENWEWARERFLDEARTLAGFSHPAIVGVHRLIEANGTVYMVMDYVDGESYETRLRRVGRVPDQTGLVEVIAPILRGLQEVHSTGLIHRDIKTENILINRHGQPVLIDFGSARSAVGATKTMTSIVTHGYSPIEQYQTKGKMGPWTDIYALGAVMCRAITGEKPPVASDRIVEDDFIWLSNRGLAGFDKKLLAAIDWSLRVRSEDRPQQIADWEAHLQSNGFDSPTKPEPVVQSTGVENKKALVPPEPSGSGPQQRRQRTDKNHRSTVIGVIAGFAVLAFVAVGIAVFQANENEKRVAAAAQKAETARQETARQETARQETARQETARQEVARQEAARQEAAALKKAEEEKMGAWKKATKELPYENSLGMKFVPVPGTDVLFSIWHTRVKDFRAYAESAGYRQEGGIYVWDGSKWEVDAGASWERPGFAQGADHPVVGVSWLEAQAFCAWLTEKERAEGKIGKEDAYRLPTDAQWSVAAGSGKYPWGNEWPPPKNAGNYHPSLEVDSYEFTSPVGSFPANRHGLYDMGGNVWQWCADWYRASMNESVVLEKFPGFKDDGGGQTYRVVRGASWDDDYPEFLLSSSRGSADPDGRVSTFGFRCVLVVGSSR
jgi:serine/threonine protein kinase